MPPQDHYKVLGVGKKATQDEIKKAYRKLARQYHPDANPGDAAAEERFKEVQGAYDVLSDSGKRKEYDAFGSAGGPQGFPGGSGGGPGGFSFDFGDLSDLSRDERERYYVNHSITEGVRRELESLLEFDTGTHIESVVHEALLSQPSAADEGSVIQVLQKGYRLGDRVLRPARVVVAGPKEDEASDGDQA